MRQVRLRVDFPPGDGPGCVTEFLEALRRLTDARGMTLTDIVRGGTSVELSRLGISDADVGFLVDAGVETTDQLGEEIYRSPSSPEFIFTGKYGWARHRRVLRKLLIHGSRRPFGTRSHLAEFGSTMPEAIYGVVVAAGKGALDDLCALDAVDLLQIGLNREQVADLQRRLYAWHKLCIAPLRPDRRLGDLLDADVLALLEGTEYGPETPVIEAMAAWWDGASQSNVLGRGFNPSVHFRWPLVELGVGYQDGVAVVLPLRKGR